MARVRRPFRPRATNASRRICANPGEVLWAFAMYRPPAIMGGHSSRFFKLRLRSERLANPKQYVTNRLDEPFGNRRQRHLAPDRHEEFVTERVPQARQCAAQR